jgi:predicted dithiol-disulfide oxidoreductase (DUF899 family)
MTYIFQGKFGKEKFFQNHSDFMPHRGSDCGICSAIIPQLAFNRSLQNVSIWDKYVNKIDLVKPGAKVGEWNGMTYVIDTEASFNYDFAVQEEEGVKVAIHHHRDYPIMAMSSGNNSETIFHTYFTYLHQSIQLFQLKLAETRFTKIIYAGWHYQNSRANNNIAVCTCYLRTYGSKDKKVTPRTGLERRGRIFCSRAM